MKRCSSCGKLLSTFSISVSTDIEWDNKTRYCVEEPIPGNILFVATCPFYNVIWESFDEQTSISVKISSDK